jgi:hypothetical protein
MSCCVTWEVRLTDTALCLSSRSTKGTTVYVSPEALEAAVALALHHLSFYVVQFRNSEIGQHPSGEDARKVALEVLAAAGVLPAPELLSDTPQNRLDRVLQEALVSKGKEPLLTYFEAHHRAAEYLRSLTPEAAVTVRTPPVSWPPSPPQDSEAAPAGGSGE